MSLQAFWWDTRRVAHFRSMTAALTYHWRGFPLCLLMHFIMSRLCPSGSPMEVRGGPLVLLPDSSPPPPALPCLCLSVHLLRLRVTCQVHRMWASITSRLDHAPPPPPFSHTSGANSNQCHQYHISISYLVFSYGCCYTYFWNPPHKDVTEPTGINI